MAWLLPLLLAVAGQRTRVVLNTDPGVDDAMAIFLLAQHPGVDLRGLAVNFGNSPNVTLLTKNALALLELAGRTDVPVATGASLPIAAPWVDLGGEKFHGKNGLGGVELPPPSRSPDTRSAAQLIVDECRAAAKDGAPIALITIAPLSNIAIAMTLEPDLPRLCPDLYVMGGTVTAAGNVSPLAEANVGNDAEAAQRVLSASSGFNMHVAALDVTMVTMMTMSYLRSLRATGTACGRVLYDAFQEYAAAYRSTGYPTVPAHDPSAVMLLLYPELYGFNRWVVDTVVTSPFPDPTRAMFVVDRRGGPLSPPPPSNATNFATSVDVPGFLSSVHEMIAALP